MSRLRSSMILLGICVVALLLGFLRLATQRAPLPTGSSYSAQPNGAQGLFEWAKVVGANPRRIQEALIPVDQANTSLLVLQPETMLSEADRDALDVVPQNGGTLILAGDSVPWLLYARALGIVVDTVPPGPVDISPPDQSLTVNTLIRFHLRASGATPLLVAPDGGSVALRMPYKGGDLVVLATPELLLNSGLRGPSEARFVYREILSPTLTHALTFDEAHHSYAPPSLLGAPVTLDQLLFTTPVGRAVIYAAVLGFVCVLLGSRRLGPPLASRPPSETRRTMFEHVQMLANLYRRARQMNVVRSTFSRHYGRLLARAGAGSPARGTALAQAIGRIESARSEAELIEAVGAASDAL